MCPLLKVTTETQTQKFLFVQNLYEPAEARKNCDAQSL